MNKKVWSTFVVASLFFCAEGMDLRVDDHSRDYFIDSLKQQRIELTADRLANNVTLRKYDGICYLTVNEIAYEKSWSKKKKCYVKKKSTSKTEPVCSVYLGNIENLPTGNKRLTLQTLAVCYLSGEIPLFEKVTEIILSESIKELGKKLGFYTAFPNLEIISGKSVINVADTCALGRLARLNKICFPNLKNFGQAMFLNCSSLTKIELPETVEQVDYGCFWGCDKLKSVTCKTQNAQFGSCVFRECEKLEYIFFPEGFNPKIQAYWAFLGSPLEGKFGTASVDRYGCIKIPSDVVLVPYAVTYMSRLHKLEFEESAQYQENNIEIPVWFAHACKNLIELLLPRSGTLSIDEHAFEKCGITHINFPDTTSLTLGYECFSYCRNLKQVNFPVSKKREGANISLGAFVFFGCEKLNEVNFDDTAHVTLGQCALDGTNLTSFRFPGRTSFMDKASVRNVLPDTIQIVELSDRKLLHPKDFRKRKFSGIIMVPAHTTNIE